MQIIPDSKSFNSFERSGPRQETRTVTFSGPVTQATAILTGFNAAFSPSDGDHHLGNLEIQLRTQINAVAPQQVDVTITFGLRDWSNEWDDKYEGVINYVVIGE